MIRISAVTLLAGVMLMPAVAQKTYDPGVTDKESVKSRLTKR